MPIYIYKAKSAEGKEVKGEIEASDLSAVRTALKEKGFFPISISKKSLLDSNISFSFLDKVKIKDISVFCRQFATVINSGVSVMGALDILRQQTDHKQLKAVVEKMYEMVQKGNSLSSAMREHKVFPDILLNMVEAGEVSGTLDSTMDRMAAHFEKENKINQKVKGAMSYPIIVGIIASIVVVILLTQVVPTFVGMFAGAGMELPGTTKALLGISSFLQTKWYILIIVVGGAVGGFKFYTSKDPGKTAFDALKLKMPIFGPINKKVIATRFTRTLSTLLASGLPLMSAMEVVAKVVENHVVEVGLKAASEEVSRGVSLSQPITNMGIFPPLVTYMIKIGEDTGSMESVLEKTADFYDAELETALEQLTTLMEPLIIVVMAVVVGFIVLSIIQPMFGMFETIG